METWKLLDGETEIHDEGAAVRFRVRCKPPCEPSRLLRCYGEADPQDLLIGVLEPQDGRLTLDRRISRETLRQAGIQKLPTRFYLSDGGAKTTAAASEPAPAASPETDCTDAAPPQDSSPANQTQAEAASHEQQPAVPGATAPTLSQKHHLKGIADTAAAEEPSAPAENPVQESAAPAAGHAQAPSAAGIPLPPAKPAPHGPSPLAHRRAAAPAAAHKKETVVWKTGDILLDAVIARGEAHCEQTPSGLRITCPFSPKRPFALAFIAPLCHVEHRIAVLDWKTV